MPPNPTPPYKKFRVLREDENHIPIQSPTAFATVDGTIPTPIISPTTYTGAISPITPPINAISVDLAPSTDMRISEDPVMASYTIIPAGSEIEFGISEMPTFYIKADAAGGSLFFRFNIIK